jgi:hypothetical protein
MTKIESTQDAPPVYRPDGKVLRAFLRDNSFVQIIQGPWGSGKSVASCMKIWMYATRQKADSHGIRKSRWVVVRNTYPDLENTTIKTWLEWFPESAYGVFRRSKPFLHKIVVPWPQDDGSPGQVDLEVIFLALEDEEDRKKLLSLEVTGFWFNEVRETEKGIVDDATGRAGRYPRKIDGGPTWWGVIADTNAPDEEHWIPIMRGDVPPPEHFSEDEITEHKKPENWAFFNQPAGMLEEYDSRGILSGYIPNPEAENVKYHPPGYYGNAIKGKKPSWIRVNILNKLGRTMEGRPVFEMFKEDVNIAREKIPIDPHALVCVGIDFGRTPSAVFGQCIRGQWRIVHELCAQNMGATIYGPMLKREIAMKFPGMQVALWGDPAGDDPNQSSDDTPYRIFRALGLKVTRAYHNNKLSIRLSAVENVLKRQNDDNTGPGLIISPSCLMAKNAMMGGYQFKKMKTSGSARYSDLPDKNKYSHIADAIQYMLLGAGEGTAVLNNVENRARPVRSPKNYNVFTRRR